jgi:hypothetical protein
MLLIQQFDLLDKILGQPVRPANRKNGKRAAQRTSK